MKAGSGLWVLLAVPLPFAHSLPPAEEHCIALRFLCASFSPHLHHQQAVITSLGSSCSLHCKSKRYVKVFEAVLRCL